ASSGWMLFFTSTDWRRAVFENGFEHKQTLTVSGGGPNSAYYLSGTYADQQGVIRYGDDGNKRYNLRLNFDYDVSKRIRVESRLASITGPGTTRTSPSPFRYTGGMTVASPTILSRIPIRTG